LREEEDMLSKELVKKIRQIQIRTNRLVDETLGGEYHSLFKGQGMEFSEVREYQDGDDIRTVDWNVTSRTGKLFVKKYVEERELTVMIVVDASGSFQFGSVGRFKNDLAAELAALFAFSAIKNNDRVGLILFTDKVEKYLPPAKGTKHVLHVIRELLYFKPSGKGTDINGALQYLNRIARKKSVVFLISDFTNDDYEKAMRITNRKHDLVVIKIYDPREKEIPAIGLVRLKDNETGEEIVIDGSSKNLRETLSARWNARDARLSDFLDRSGIDFVSLDDTAPYIKTIVQFFKKRTRQRR
jgi:uncharacterized protein (DUF58 family)